MWFAGWERARNNWKEIVLGLLLVFSVSVAAGGIVYTMNTPDRGSGFTEFYLLTENESGALVATGYPTEFAPGERKPLVIGIENHEGQPTNYTVVAELQRVEQENGSTSVVEQREIRRFRTTASENETKLIQHSVNPPMNGTQLRLVYLLYRGDPPANPTVENAYRETHLQINVSG